MNISGRTNCFFGLAFGAAILYASLLPFSFEWRPLGEAWDAFLGLGSNSSLRLSLTDFATNFLLFVLLAFCWAGCPRFDRARSGTVLLLVTACAAFSAGIEFAQVFLPRRSSSIYDLVANISGAFVGALAWGWLGTYARTAGTGVTARYLLSDDLHRRLCRILVLAAAPYVLALSVADGWFAGPWLSAGDALSRLGAIPLIPFYAHQQANIVLALASLVWQCALYVPLGLALRVLTRARVLSLEVLLMVGAFGAGLAAVLEGGKLFIPGKHPDVGDIVIAALGAIIGFVLWPVAMRFVQGGATSADSPQGTRPAAATRVPLRARATAVLLAAGVIAALSRFPVMPGLLAAGLVAYALALTRWPWLWLWVVPAALPLLDLAPFSGWFFFDEFDFVVLTTMVVSLWKGRVQVLPALLPGARAWLVILLATSVFISTLLGLWPLQPVDWNAFSSYYSHYNALRVAKGFLWPFLLLPVLQYNLRDGVDVRRHFAAGVIAGLAGVAVLALWERIVYPGLFDFSREFRVGAFFSSMHNGGSSVEAYIVMAAPFLVVGAYLSRSWLIRIAMGILFVAATYVLMVTFSRGGYLAYAVSLAVLIAASMRVAVVQARLGPLAGFLTVSAVSLLVAMPILLGSFAQQRISTSLEDFDVRLSHWEDAIGIMDPSLTHQVFGMGLGRYPETFFYRNQEGRLPATIRYESEEGNSYVKLGFGDRLYLEQVVNVAPNRDYRLSLDVRSSKGPALVNVLVCERTYFYSYGCESATIGSEATGERWVRREATLNSGRLGRGTWPARRPVKLSLENASPGNWVDVDNISLLDENATNLVANGDFSRGNAHWFFSSKDHLPWNTKNLWVGLLFEQGWLGVLAFGAIALYALVGLARNAWRGDLFGGAALAAAIGYLCVGLVDGLVEAPRLTTMFFLSLVVSGVVWKSAIYSAPEPMIGVTASGDDANAPEPREAGTTFGKRGVDSDGSRAAGPMWSSALPLKSAVYRTLVGIMVGALLIGVVTHSPWVPYNVRDLPSPAHPYAALVILAVFCYWIFAAPVWMARSFARSRIAMALFPGSVVLHGVIAWAIVHYAVYPVMIHKVTGSPVLGWPWWWEDLARFAVLEGTLFLLLTGACTIVLVGIGKTGMKPMCLWLGWAILLLPVAHHVIVVEAATDNLTELMAGGGTALAGLTLAVWLMVLGVGASILAVCLATQWHRAAAGLLLVMLSIPLGYVLASLGTEEPLEKYGTVFSALQFLLSTDRNHYATGWQLGLRYLVFHSALLCAVAFAQYPLWRIPLLRERAAAPRANMT